MKHGSYKAVLTVLLALFAASASFGSSQYQVVSTASVPAGDKAWITQVATETYSLLDKAGFVAASDVQPTVWIFTDADKEAFFQELVKSGVVQLPIEEVRQRFAKTELLTSSLTLTLYVKAGSQSTRTGSRYAIAKEASRLFGIYLASGKEGVRAFTWLREGFTEVYAARVIDANGGTSYAENRRGALDNARRFIAAGGPTAVTELETPAQWDSAQRTANLRAYGIAFLAYEYLEQRLGAERVRQYFVAFRDNADRQNFEKAFGITPEAFAGDFAAYLRTLVP